MGTHNTFYGEIRKMITKYSSLMGLLFIAPDKAIIMILKITFTPKHILW